MGVLELRTELETLLADELGTYTLANGHTTPAISVRPEGTSLSAGRQATGLEVVIVEEPVLRPIRQYRNEQAFSVWTVNLLQWGALAASDYLSAVASKVLNTYSGSSFRRVPVGSNSGPTARMILEIVTNPEGSAT